jgi:hypothetical protein
MAYRDIASKGPRILHIWIQWATSNGVTSKLK